MQPCSTSMRFVQLINLGQKKEITTFVKLAVNEQYYGYKPSEI